MSIKILSAVLAAGALVVTGPAMAAPKGDLAGAARAKAPKFVEDQALISAIGGAWRPAAEVARDKYRHPLESLTFWGLRPHMVVVDLQPGGGYWTQILAPYAKATGGSYIAGVQDLASPKMTEGGRKARDAFAKKFSDEAIYGKIELANFGATSAPFAPPGTVDLVLTSRELHNWAAGGLMDKIMGDAFAALKPGGFLAVEDHRADPRPEVDKVKDGYISTATVVAAAKKAGFVLDASSEVNANPKDTKDHPFGVWTLPPTRQSSGSPDNPGAANPNFDHSKYDAIGESDRMTLRFRKPG